MILNERLYGMWYRNLSVQYAMFSFVKKEREYMLKALTHSRLTTRHMQVVSVQSFQWWQKRIETGDELFPKSRYQDFFNKYYSLACYEPFPLTLSEQNSFGKGRHGAVCEYFTKRHLEYIKDFDFLIDVDAPSMKYIHTAYADTLKIASFLDECGCPYRLRFSGKGFHIIIPHAMKELESFGISSKLLLDVKSAHCLFRIYSKILEKLRLMFSDLVDESISDSRRVTKIPFSLAVYKHNAQLTAFTCFEFSPQERADFSTKLFEPAYWIRNGKIFKNEGYLFNPYGSAQKFFERMKIEKSK